MAGADAQQMVHHLKPLLPLRKINPADVHDALELALRVITQEGEHRHDAGGGNVERQFVFEDGELLDEFGEALY